MTIVNDRVFQAVKTTKWMHARPPFRRDERKGPQNFLNLAWKIFWFSSAHPFRKDARSASFPKPEIPGFKEPTEVFVVWHACRLSAFQNENHTKHYLVLTENRLETWKEKFDAEPPLPFLVETNKFLADCERGCPPRLRVRGSTARTRVVRLFIRPWSRSSNPVSQPDHVQDPHNVGALMRRALALGAHGILVTSKHAAPLTSAVAKAAAGALDKLPVLSYPASCHRRSQSKRFLMLGPQRRWRLQSKPYSLHHASSWFGEEGKGLRSLTKNMWMKPSLAL